MCTSSELTKALRWLTDINKVENRQVHNVHINVFDKLIWHNSGPRSSYFALHSSLFGPVAQLVMIILSLTALTFSELAQDVFPMAHTLTILSQFGPCFKTYQNLWYT